MTQEEFIKVLDKKGYSYKIEGDKIVVTEEFHVHLRATSLPSGVVFKNEGYIHLYALTSLPPDVVFKNEGGVHLYALTSLPPGVEFRNGGDVDLRALTSLPPGVEFSNEWSVRLDALIGGWFFEWKGNIEGIKKGRLLNLMIKRGMFI